MLIAILLVINSIVSSQITSEFATSAFRIGFPLMKQTLSMSNIYQNFIPNNVGGPGPGPNQFFPPYQFYRRFFQSEHMKLIY